jgi:hypothetical protein
MTIVSGTASTGDIYFADGTGAQNRGFLQYHHADDSLRLGTAATIRMRIDSTGRVGINRTPAQANSKLEVGGADNVSLIMAEASGATAGIGVRGGGIGLYTGTTSHFMVNTSGAATLTAALGVGNGTASLPSLSFAGDLNTGLFLGNSDQLNFAIGGQDKAFFSTNQFNVSAKIVATELDINGNADVSGTLAVSNKITGVAATNRAALELTGGTASQSYTKIHMLGAGTAVDAIRIQNDGGHSLFGTDKSDGAGLASSTTNYSTVMGSIGATAAHIVTNNSVKMTVLSGGNVGIGTAAPNSQLTVGGTGQSSTESQILTSTSGAGYLYFGDGTSGAARYAGYIGYYHNGDYMTLNTAAVPRIRLDADGLKFNADTAAANALDDYEEGTWVPLMGGWSSATRKSAGSTNAGRYTKIGDMCTVFGTMHWNGSETIAGGILVSGLPFTAVGSGVRAAGALGGTSGVAGSPAATYPGLRLTLDPGNAFFYLIEASSSGYDHSPTISNEGHIYGISFTYKCA